MLTIHTKATPHPDVVFTELENGESVLLHLGTHAYYTLNETGVWTWRLMSDGLTLGEIVQALEAQYEVSSDRAQQSVINLVTELAAEKLVSLSDDSQVISSDDASS